jgi:hypothetical protein
MGKAVGGGVYSLEQATEQPDPAKPGTLKRIKVDLHSVEFSGHMKPALWDQLRQELVDLEQKYQQLGAPNFKVKLQTRHSK